MLSIEYPIEGIEFPPPGQEKTYPYKNGPYAGFRFPTSSNLEWSFKDSIPLISGVISREDLALLISGNFTAINNADLKRFCEEGKSFRAEISKRDIIKLQLARGVFADELIAAIFDETKDASVFRLTISELRARGVDPESLAEKIKDETLELFFLAEPDIHRLDEIHSQIRAETRANIEKWQPPSGLLDKVNTPSSAPSGMPSSKPSMSRRAMLISGLSGVAVAGLIGAVAYDVFKRRLEDQPQVQSSAPASTRPKNPEDKEAPFERTSFELILEKSLPSYLAETKTYRDNILDPYAVSDYFLQSRFRYTGKLDEVNYHGRSMRAHRFGVIGAKSGFLGRKGKGKELWKTTDAATLLNTFFSSMPLNDETIRRYLAWTYEKSFGIKLDPDRIRLIRKQGKRTFSAVYYDPPAGFDSTVKISVVQAMEDVSALQPGGRASKHEEPQEILGRRNRLLLPSGISPEHDVIIPVSLLNPNPTFTLQLNGYGNWSSLTAQYLAESIVKFEQRLKETAKDRFVKIKVYKRTLRVEKMAKLVERDNPLIRTLVTWLIRDVKGDASKILAITRFVQDLPYKWEHDTDIDRPALITLFNGGGDCNNLTLLWTEFMLAAGYDAAIIQSDQRKEDYMIHARGGIPSRYFPGRSEWGYPDKGYFVPIELAGDRVWEPGLPLMGKDTDKRFDETVFLVEPLSAKQP